MTELSDQQSDALGEMVNVGIGRAAASLSEMTRDEVLLSIPKLQFIARSSVERYIGESGELVAVKQRFDGVFNGEALLFFPEDRSLELVRTVLGDTIPVESMSNLEEEALLEIGNVLLNACLSTFGDTLELEVRTGLPSCHRGTCAEIMATGRREDDERVLFIGIDFSLKGQAINGYVVFILSVDSIQELLPQVDAYLERMGIPIVPPRDTRR